MSQHTNSPHYPPLITALLTPTAYAHPCGDIRCIETHISWLLLTGDYVYKIKKPVNFGFVDFSTLSRRQHFCAEEIRLNSRLAPQLYLGVIAITLDRQQLRMNGNGPVQEYAVKMQQFDNTYLFDRLIKHHQLSPQMISETAQRLAQFHHNIAIADEHSRFGSAPSIHQPVQENFSQLAEMAAAFIASPKQQQRIAHIRQWSEQRYKALKDTFVQRKIDGFIRECHGDLHLGNIVLIDGQVTPFDGIEFNPDLRWIDIISEIAFLLMDLQHRGRADLAHRLLNAWLENTGDYTGLSVLRYYQCYRAMVRAKVAALTAGQDTDTETKPSVNNYIKLADTYTRGKRPMLFIMHGLSGSGKSSLSQNLLEACGLIRLRSDVERKRLAGLSPLASSQSSPDTGIYSAAFTQQTFARLENLARQTLHAGYCVLVDATFLQRHQRDPFRQLAQSLHVPFLIIHCQTDNETLRQRVHQRHAAGQDASEAGLLVLQRQLNNHQPLSADEQHESITLDTTGEMDIRPIEKWIEQNS